MTPEYIEQLADWADPDKLWQTYPWQKSDLTPEQRRQMDAGVALRRHARDVRDLNRLRGTDQSLLVTPLGLIGRRLRYVPTPKNNKDPV